MRPPTRRASVELSRAARENLLVLPSAAPPRICPSSRNRHAAIEHCGTPPRRAAQTPHRSGPPETEPRRRRSRTEPQRSTLPSQCRQLPRRARDGEPLPLRAEKATPPPPGPGRPPATPSPSDACPPPVESRSTNQEDRLVRLRESQPSFIRGDRQTTNPSPALSVTSSLAYRALCCPGISTKWSVRLERPQRARPLFMRKVVSRRSRSFFAALCRRIQAIENN